MSKKMTYTLIGLAVVVGVLALVKYNQIQAAIAMGESYQPPPEAVTTIVTASEPWSEGLTAIGTVRAVQGVTVSADLSGVVRSLAFESGSTVDAGKVLMRLDTRQEQAQLRAAQARLELTRVHRQRVEGLREKGVTSQAEYDLAVAEHAEAEARVGEIQATIARKTIRAPFAGVLGIRQVNVGQYLNGGDPVVPLQALDPVYVDFSLPQQQLSRLPVGGTVEVDLEGAPEPQIRGQITAIDSVVDSATRNVMVQASFDNPDAVLKPGMFVDVRIAGAGTGEYVTLPASSISYAPYGDSVYIVEEMEGPDGESYTGVRQQFVQLGPTRGDQVAVRSGVDAGQEVVTSGVFKLRSGAAVVVNNDVQPGNDPTPTPENS